MVSILEDFNMPYTFRKQGNKYVVFKKKSDGSPGERVGATKGTKEALKKYLAALHVNETETIMKPIKLAQLIERSNSNDTAVQRMTSEQKQAFLEAVYQFAEHSKSIYRKHSIAETAQYLKELIEAASQLTLAETEDWFDQQTVNRHMKHLNEAFKIFEKTATEMETLQQRLEASYDDIGETLSKYYDFNGMVTEADGADYQKFFQKAMKKFKVDSPAEFETDQQKKKFFKYIDKGYTSKKEK